VHLLGKNLRNKGEKKWVVYWIKEKKGLKPPVGRFERGVWGEERGE